MDDGSIIPSKEDEAAAEAFRSAFPDGLPPARPAAGSAIVRFFPLEVEHLQALATANAAGNVIGITTEPRQKMSRTHHRLAQLLAMGMEVGRAAVVCNYAPAVVSILRSDPLFMELEHYYSLQVNDEFQTVIQQMADLHEDVIAEIRTRLENDPNQFTISSLTELFKSLSDRVGHGPTSNINAKVATLHVTPDDLTRIKAAPAAPTDQRNGQVGQLTEADRQSLNSVFTLSARDVTPAVRPQRLGEGEGTGLREAGDNEVDQGVVVSPDGAIS